MQHEMKRNGMEWNGTTTGGTAPQQCLHNCVHLLHIFAFCLSLSSSLSRELLFCAFGRQLQQFARAAFVHKKNVTKKLKKKKKTVARKLHSEARLSSRHMGVAGKPRFCVLRLVQMFSLFYLFIFCLSPSSYITIFSPRPLNKLHKHLLPD